MRKLSADELGRLSIDDFKTGRKLPVIVILDHVRSMHNVGSIFRTSDAFAIEELFLCGITGQPPHREIEKTALGATQSVPWRHFPRTIDAVDLLRKEGYAITAVEQTVNSISLSDYQPVAAQKIALIFGNEVNGVSDDVLERCDNSIEIPQFGTKHSFNIVVSAGIVLWDIYSKLQHLEQR